MIEVTKRQFYEYIFGAGLNVHPSPERMQTTWKYSDGRLFAEATPGYLLQGATSYRLTPAAHADMIAQPCAEVVL